MMIIVEPLVVSLFVIVQNKFRDGTMQGRASDQDESIQTGLLDAPNESFRERIQIR